MEQVLIDLLPQLGLAAVILYLLMEEKKARKELEDRITKWLDEMLDDNRKERPEGL